MTDTRCSYPARDEALATYLYDDFDDAARAAFDAHLALCTPCQVELAELQGVRRQLAAWQPPAPAVGASMQLTSAQGTNGQPWWRAIPAWAQVAAALLCLGAGAGLANLDIRYDAQGLAIRTGWRESRPAADASSTSVASTPVRLDRAATPDAAPWRADLTALERQLRSDFQTTQATGAAAALVARPAMSDAELLKRVRALVDESERRQERELALRVGQVLRDVNAQRQADLRKIDSNLGFIQSNTGAEVLKQRQLLMHYIVRASSQK
jgi:hypothetical protein